MITAEGLTKRYGSTVAVDGLSFTVLPGRVTGFLGPNGAGKSTTMRMILGLDRPDAGTALVNGRAYCSARVPMRQVGALLDAKDVHGGRTAGAHLAALCQANGISRDRVGAVLALTGLTAVAGRRIGGFSLGMAQRLGIAAALLGDPQVLIFDEPVNGLDPEGIVWIRQLMQGLAERGRTVFVSSHLMSEMALTADHLIVIGRGRLLAEASMSEFVAAHSGGRTRVRSPHSGRLASLLRPLAAGLRMIDGALEVDGLSPAQVGDLAAGNGVTVHELVAHRSSLEEAFMQLTRDSVDYQASTPAGEVGCRTDAGAPVGAVSSNGGQR